MAEKRDKLEMLIKISNSINPRKALVFINRVADIEGAVDKLKHHHYSAECIHGTKSKNDRKRVIEDFQKGNLKFLIATDIAARGLHVEGVTTVFHLSIPENSLDYLHRAGRAGRNGEKGISISIVTKEELAKIKMIQKAFGINIVAKKMYQGKIVRG